MGDLKGDEIVISGISGIFPEADNVQELSEKLYKKVNMINKSDKHLHIKHPEFPHYLGSVKGMEKFDATFFRVTSQQAVCMDPVMKKLMEHAMSAIFDAGVNPEILKKSRLGVYIASTTIDSFNAFFDDVKGHPFLLSGSSKCMFANRISYWINGNGPSYSLDQGYAGSMSALEQAYNDIKSNKVDCAIVGGCNYCLKPELTLNLKRAGLLCVDGKTKCFDRNGDGFVRSDAINVYLLQKAKDAKRIYTEVYGVKGKYFASPDDLFTPRRNPDDIEQFLEEFYSEININPNNVEYIETNSVGIAQADNEELEAIGNIYKKRNTIKVGSIKSNMGHTECVSGACSITKMCLAYHTGHIPANLHFKEPVLAVLEKNVKVVTETEPFLRKFTAINNFCHTGSNFHTLLKGHYKSKDLTRYNSKIPRLILVSSRKEDGVNKMLNSLESNPIDPEQLALLNNIFKHYIPGYTARGHIILDTNHSSKTASLSRGFEYFSGKTRPVWFLYSGMGSQWAGMGEGLLRIPVFAATIQRCHDVLLTKNLDLIDIITNKDDKTLNILKSLVAITAIQIGLTEVLKSIGIVPDNLIGHSLGEICCAYADGALTLEQAILTAYFRALVSYETEFIKGTMAAVGLGYKEVIKSCPPGIEVACHNSSESATISGPSDAVAVFVKTLTDQGIFAKEVASYNIAFHSQYISKAGPKMFELLKTTIKNPKPRSDKWLSTCYLPEDWHKQESKYASAEYFTHNLMNSVLFEEASRFIPEDAVIIEIAPHGLLQAIMKRSHNTCVNISLTKRNANDGSLFLLKAIGSLYQLGINPDLESLYPKVEFPVSTETPLLSHLVEWDHDTDWVFNTNFADIESTVIKKYIISPIDDDYVFLRNHFHEGMIILPEARILVFVWETLAFMNKKYYENTPVTFHNIKFYDIASMKVDDTINIEVSIQKSSGNFEVLYKNKVIADGIANLITKSSIRNKIMLGENDRHLTHDDINTLMRVRGYAYERKYLSIESINIKRSKATFIWRKQTGWISFIDSMIKMQALSNDHDGLSYVKLINNLTINTDAHKYHSFSSDGEECYNALFTKATGIIECGEVIIKDMVFKEIPKKNIVNSNHNMIINISYDNNKATEKNRRIALTGKYKIHRTTLIAKEINNLESLSWANAPVTYDKTTIQLHYSGLSSKDVKKIASSNNKNFGMDFSGIDHNGKRVMGLLPGGAMSNIVEVDYNRDLIWPVPQHWSLADAATVPLPYVHAFYCLIVRHKLCKNNTILVIGAAGALGQAVISIALHMGCRIFATVGNADKKRFLLRLFPQLDENNVSYTYDNSFRTMVIERTRNKRCNVVISTASGKIREDAMSCVGEEIINNFFLDVNDSDQCKNEDLTMAYLDGDKTYKSVNMSAIFDQNYKKYLQVIYQKVCEGISDGYVKPLTRVIYSPFEVARAFKLLSNRCNIGRVMIDVKDLNKPNQNLAQSPRIVLLPNKAYIVVCDGSELGVELINLLIERGAKRLLIHCYPKTINGYFHVRYASWKNRGVTIEMNSDELELEENCQKFLNGVKGLGFSDVDGVFITHNAFTQQKVNQHIKRIVSVVSNMDRQTRDPKSVRYFAVINAAKTQDISNVHDDKELEKQCVGRYNQGLPALFLQHNLNGEAWDSNSLQVVFNGLETSLMHQYVSVCTSSEQTSFGSNINNISYTKFNAGFGAFYRKHEKHEFDATEPIIYMNTEMAFAIEHELTVDPNTPKIFLIPGFDGNSESLSTVAERLKIPAIALQADLNTNESVTEIAKNMLNHISLRFRLKSPFYLMGYSFGVNIALEIAALLEKQGLVGVVYCLDSSPDALRSQLGAYLGNSTEETLQNSLIEYMYSIFAGRESNELKIKLKETMEWSDKVQLFINAVKCAVQHSQEYLINCVQATYNRITLAKEYKPRFILESKLILLKGIPHPEARGLSNDYNLSSYTNKPVQVFDINSDHAMALYDCRVSNFINRTL